MEAKFSARLSLLLHLCFLLSLIHTLTPCGSDPSPLQDFCVANLQAQQNTFPCKNANDVQSEDFYFSGLAKKGNITVPGVRNSPARVLEFPGLNTLGVSMNRFDLLPGAVNPPHTHPRASELVLVLKGRVLIGFVTGSNVLYSKVVRSMELFVVPKGMMHFQQNVGKGIALFVAAFDSQLPGVLRAPSVLFGTKPAIPSQVLATAFQIEEVVVDSMKSKLNGTL